MSQLVSNEFFRGLKRKASDSKEINIFEPTHKRQKLIEEDNVEPTEEVGTSEIEETVQTTDLSAFGNLLSDIIDHHIVVFIPIEWLNVSKHYHKIAMMHLDGDPRIKWDENSFLRALEANNLAIVIRHLEKCKFDEFFLQDQFTFAVQLGHVKIVQYLLNNYSLSPVEKSELHSSCLCHAISSGHEEIIALLLCSGRVIQEDNVYLRTAIHAKRKDIAETLIANGFFARDSIFTVILDYVQLNNPDALQILFQTVNFTFSHDESLALLNKAIVSSANHVVDYLLSGILAPLTAFDTRFILTTISLRNIQLLERLLLDKRFAVTTEILDRVIVMDSKKILRVLLADPRMQSLASPSYLVRKAIIDNSRKILRWLLDDPNLDVASCVDAELLKHTLKQNPDNPSHVVLMLLDDPRINFHYYASFTLCTALQNNCCYIAESVLNHNRFVVMDEAHYQTAMDCATKSFRTFMIQRLEKIPHVAKLSPSEFWTM